MQQAFVDFPFIILRLVQVKGERQLLLVCQKDIEWLECYGIAYFCEAANQQHTYVYKSPLDKARLEVTGKESVTKPQVLNEIARQ